MATDIQLDAEGQDWITLDATALKTTASDLIIDCPTSHHGAPGLRRAVVHDQGDGLTLNYNRDYPGGITLNDVSVRLKVHLHIGRPPELPRRAEIGELYAVSCIPIEEKLREVAISDMGRIVEEPSVRRSPINKALIGLRDEMARPKADISLWLCVGTGTIGQAIWQRIALGDTIDGTL